MSQEASSVQIPLYCYPSKFFLVEELALSDKFHELHYGRCCIIGKIAVDSTDPTKLFIENIRLPSLPQEYSLPEGTVKLRIVTSSLHSHVPQGKICEIVGEVILYDVIDPLANRVPLTAKDVAERLSYLQFQNSSESEYNNYLLNRYQPAVKVDHLKPVERGAELIEHNFEETTQYSDQLVTDWITFWETKGEEIVNTSWSHKYSDYLLKEEASEHEIETENAPNRLKEETLGHQEDIGETHFGGNSEDNNFQADTDDSSRQEDHQVETENAPHREDTELVSENLEDNFQAETNKIGNHLKAQNQVGTENTPNRLEEKTIEHQKDTVEALVSKNSEKTYLLAETAEPSWQEVWDEHYSELYHKTYKHYSIGHHNHYCFYRPTIEEILEEYPSESEEDEVEFLDQTEELLALGLPTSFSGKNKRLYDFCSESMTDEEAEMVNTEIPAKPEKWRKKYKNCKLRRIPKVILENKSLRSYWQKRFSLFSRFDEGIQLDRESWFSVTPEKVAIHMAERLRCDTIIDAFCGSGGNAIQFAFACSKVIAIDIDAEKIKNARHNAIIYGVANKIDFIIGDFLQLCDSLKGDVVFLSPPWGGPKYMSKKEYDIEESLAPVGASALAEKARQISENIAFFLPRNSIPKQMAKIAGVGKRVEIEHNFLDTRLIGLTAIYGDWLIDKKNLSDM